MRPTKAAAPALVFALFATLCAAGIAHAGRLEPAEDAPRWVHLGAALVLGLHIGGGLVGLLAGFVASFSRKGGSVHRTAGKVFFVSMAICYAIAAAVAPFLDEGWRTNTVAAFFALYLLISGTRAARTSTVRAGPAVYLGLCVAASVTGLGLLFAAMGASHPSGTLDGSPPEAFATFIVGGVVALVDEVNVIVRKELTGPARVTRHLWRMCASFFYASGSFFVGQPQVFPDAFNRTPLPALLAFFPLLVMAGSIYLLKRKRWRLATASR